MGDKGRRAYICCRRDLREHYRNLWNERVNIALVEDMKSATDLYIVNQKDLSDDLRKEAVKTAENLKIRVHYLDRELVMEEAENYVKKYIAIGKRDWNYDWIN